MQTETLVAFEYTSGTISKPNSFVFVGGLGDGLATTSYMAGLVHAMQPTDWSIFTLNLTSSYQSWGLGHLNRDTDEIAQCIHYIKDYKRNQSGGNGKVVLMGHSTGSQMVLHYLSRPNPHTSVALFDPELEHIKRLRLDGAIMQAPVSDRECIQLVLKEGLGEKTPTKISEIYEKMVALAQDAVDHDTTTDAVLPLWMTSCIYPSNTPLSCRRFLSLTSPGSPQIPREDDLFSSDLSDEQLGKTFGLIKQRGLLNGKLLVLSSGADQSVPGWINKEDLLLRWRRATDVDTKTSIWDAKNSGVVPGASHALSNDDQAEPRKDLVRRVMGFLGNV